MKLNCIIIDDEPMARKVLQEYIDDVNFLQVVGKAEDPVKARNILEKEKIDLLFLDVNMPKMTGIEFLKNNPVHPMTILTTAYSEYALEGFELDVLDYLVKPFSFERFLKACTKAKEYYEFKHATVKTENTPSICDYIFVKSEGKIEKIKFDDLFYIEAMQNYSILYTDKNKFIVYITLKGILDQLPADRFVKIHKSRIVNVSKVKNIDGNQVDIGNAKLTISQGLYSSVVQKLLNGRLLKR